MIPLTFISPSFEQFLYVDTEKYEITVRDTRTSKSKSLLPWNVTRYLLDSGEEFSTETLQEKVFFIEDSLVLMETRNSFEIVVDTMATAREVAVFNRLHPGLTFTNELQPCTTMPKVTHTQLTKTMATLSTNNLKGGD